MNIIIPVWFYGFDSVMYLISAMIGFLLSFYFYKIYSLSSEKTHLYLYLGFLLLSTGLLSLSVADMYSYLNFINCHNACTLGLLDNVFDLEDFAYFVYFGLSLFAYGLFILAYIPQGLKLSKNFVLLSMVFLFLIASILLIRAGNVLWYSYHEYFHITALLMMVFITFRTIVNYSENKGLNSFLVVVSFSFISLFHLLHLFSFISGWMYVFAHISMLIGFGSLLFMVLRVKK